MFAEVEHTGVLSRLSGAAVKSAEALGSSDVKGILKHIYRFNSIPVTDECGRFLSGTESVREELELASDGRLSALVTQHWFHVIEEKADGWLNWIRRNRYERLAGSASAVVFKLYLSPSIEALPRAAKALIETLTFSPATSFKIGSQAVDLLRPDKMVVYFSTLPDLALAARQLTDRLAGVPPQGVPFTAEIAGDGLLSWGVDPPARARALGESARSWREWVCHQLAMGIVEAKEAGEAEPAERALARVRRLGVDTERWLPPVGSWGRALR